MHLEALRSFEDKDSRMSSSGLQNTDNLWYVCLKRNKTDFSWAVSYILALTGLLHRLTDQGVTDLQAEPKTLNQK